MRYYQRVVLAESVDKNAPKGFLCGGAWYVAEHGMWRSMVCGGAWYVAEHGNMLGTPAGAYYDVKSGQIHMHAECTCRSMASRPNAFDLMGSVALIVCTILTRMA